MKSKCKIWVNVQVSNRDLILIKIQKASSQLNIFKFQTDLSKRIEVQTQ